MVDERLEVFAKIKGISAASGLVLLRDLLYIISDNSNYLYQYNIDIKQLTKIPLLVTPLLEEIPKSEKSDFETICQYNNVIYILGSGSTLKRNRLVEYHVEGKKVVSHDLKPVYTAMKKAHAIGDDDLNIEGAVFTGTKWFLFNRGNGNAHKNGVFMINGSDLQNAKSADFVLIELPKSNVMPSFTDAVLCDDQIYFVAAAEDTTSTYNDGEILGSYVGSLDINTLKLNEFKKISDLQKFEGITFLEKKNGKLGFLICEDADTESLETVIYKLLI